MPTNVLLQAFMTQPACSPHSLTTLLRSDSSIRRRLLADLDGASDAMHNAMLQAREHEMQQQLAQQASDSSGAPAAPVYTPAEVWERSQMYLPELENMTVRRRPCAYVCQSM